MLRKAYLDGPFGQLHYVTGGAGVPIVLLHQLMLSSLQFQPAMAHLIRHGVRPIAVDLPGFGMSDGPEDPPSIEDYASIVTALLDHLGIEAAVICGHHTGASVAIAFADRHPERVSRLIMQGLPFLNDEERKLRLDRGHDPYVVEEDGSHLDRLWSLHRGAAAGASLEIVNWSVLLHGMAGSKGWFGHHAVYSYDMTAALEKLQMPVCIVSNRGDPLHFCDKRAVERRPDFTYREMSREGTYHVVFDESEEWAGIVAAFARA